MAKSEKKLVWTTFSVANNPALNAKYQAVRRAMEEVSKAKAAFEPLAKAALAKAGVAVEDEKTGDVIRIGYNFGQLSYAQDKAGEAGSKAAKVDL